MFISPRYQVIFVHIQRTGGHSIHEIFRQYDPDLIETIAIDPSKQRIRHCYAQDIQEAIDHDIFKNYHKFTVVRHPVTRLWSWYQKLKAGYDQDEPFLKVQGRWANAFQKGLHGLNRYALFKKIGLSYVWQKMFFFLMMKTEANQRILQGELTGNQVLQEVNKQAKNFDEFIHLPKSYPGGLFARFYVNQIDYLSFQDELLVDHILRFESLSEQFNQFAQKINFPGTLPHLNISKKNSIPFINPPTLKIIQERFARDFEYFDYNET